MKVAVGLDIGWKEVRVVELTEDLRVTKIGRIEIQRPVEGDESAMYASKINELFNNQKFSKDNVIISLRGSPILARTYSAPSENREDFEKWFVESIESLIPGIPIAEVVYDYQILKSGRVVISFAKLAALEDKIRILKPADIIPSSIDASCLALYNAFENHPWINEKKTFAILDCSVHSTDLLLVRDGEPIVSTEIYHGAKEEDEVFIPELVANLKKIFSYYRDKDGIEIRNLILVGDYSDFPKLRDDLKQKLNIEAEIGKPFELREIDLTKEFDVENNHYYAHALGLALKGLSKQKELNLMPQEVRKSYKVWQFDKRAKTFFRKNIIISGIALVLLVFLISVFSKTNSRINREVNVVKQKKSELAYIASEEHEFNTKISKIKQLSAEPYLWSRMIHNVGTAVPEGINLVSIATQTRLAAVGKRADKSTRIVIEGDGHDNETVLTFVKHLEKYFKNIAVNDMKDEARCVFKISLMP